MPGYFSLFHVVMCDLFLFYYFFIYMIFIIYLFFKAEIAPLPKKIFFLKVSQIFHKLEARSILFSTLVTFLRWWRAMRFPQLQNTPKQNAARRLRFGSAINKRALVSKRRAHLRAWRPRTG